MFIVAILNHVVAEKVKLVKYFY